jgi:hypothetical protein
MKGPRKLSGGGQNCGHAQNMENKTVSMRRKWGIKLSTFTEYGD